MIRNGMALWATGRSPIVNPDITKKVAYGTSYGLGEAGYDIRLKQDVRFFKSPKYGQRVQVGIFEKEGDVVEFIDGRFVIASAIEEFDMPSDLVGVVHDKSTWARQGLSVFNTVIEPGWKGFLTLELVYHGNGDLHIPAGSGIAQVLFHELHEHMRYTGKYQNQEDRPVESIFEGRGLSDEELMKSPQFHPGDIA